SASWPTPCGTPVSRTQAGGWRPAPPCQLSSNGSTCRCCPTQGCLPPSPPVKRTRPPQGFMTCSWVARPAGLMRCCRSALLGLVAVLLALPGRAAAQKAALDASIQARAEASWAMAREIWGWAEPGYQEKRSAALLADALEKAGFKVERGVAKIPTAFVATLGSGKPVIGIMGEYDALPGLAQEAVPFRQLRKETTYGHGCGHHLFGVASMTACLALGEQIKAGKIKGTLRFYGCPAEEGGSARVFMVREGLFKDCDVVLHWHPHSRNLAGSRSNMA